MNDHGLLLPHLLFIFIHILTVDLFTTDHIHIDLIQFIQKNGEWHKLFSIFIGCIERTILFDKQPTSVRIYDYEHTN